jgi:hypothetical protein
MTDLITGAVISPIIGETLRAVYGPNEKTRTKTSMAARKMVEELYKYAAWKGMAKVSGLGFGTVAPPFKSIVNGATNPTKNVASLAQRWSPPKVRAPFVKPPPAMPKLM